MRSHNKIINYKDVVRRTITHMDVFKNLHKISPRLKERDLEPKLTESVLKRRKTTISEADRSPVNPPLMQHQFTFSPKTVSPLETESGSLLDLSTSWLGDKKFPRIRHIDTLSPGNSDQVSRSLKKSKTVDWKKSALFSMLRNHNGSLETLNYLSCVQSPEKREELLSTAEVEIMIKALRRKMREPHLNT